MRARRGEAARERVAGEGRGRLQPQPGWREALERDLAAIASTSAAPRPSLGLGPGPTSRHGLGGEGGQPGAASLQEPQSAALPDQDGADADGAVRGGSPGVSARAVEDLGCRAGPGGAALGSAPAPAQGTASVPSPPEDQTGLQALVLAVGLADMEGAPGKEGRPGVPGEAAGPRTVEEQMHGQGGGVGDGASGQVGGQVGGMREAVGGDGGEVPGEEVALEPWQMVARAANGRRLRQKLECAECGGAYRQGDMIRHRNSRIHRVAVMDRRRREGNAAGAGS